MSFVLTVLVWIMLAVICWPIAVLALLLLPVIWLLLLPFRLAFWALEGMLSFVKALFMLPARLLGARG